MSNTLPDQPLESYDPKVLATMQNTIHRITCEMMILNCDIPYNYRNGRFRDSMLAFSSMILLLKQDVEDALSFHRHMKVITDGLNKT